MMDLRRLLAWCRVAVFDLDGTLASGMPYEEVLQQIAKLSGCSFLLLMQRYRERWNGLDEAQDQHRRMAPTAARQAVDDIYAEFRRQKSCPAVFPGAVNALRLARADRDQVICWTRGDRELQENVLRTTALAGFFDQVIVVPRKNKLTVREHLLPVVRRRPFFLVGDSYDQDIVPVADEAEQRVWIKESPANRCLPPPEQVDPEVIVLESIQRFANELAD